MEGDYERMIIEMINDFQDRIRYECSMFQKKCLKMLISKSEDNGINDKLSFEDWWKEKEKSQKIFNRWIPKQDIYDDFIICSGFEEWQITRRMFSHILKKHINQHSFDYSERKQNVFGKIQLCVRISDGIKDNNVIRLKNADLLKSAKKYEQPIDSIVDFFEQKMKRCENYKIIGKILYDEYIKWCDGNEGYKIKMIEFYKILRAKGNYGGLEINVKPGANNKTMIYDYKMVN